MVGNQYLRDRLANSFVGHVPSSMRALVAIYTVVVRAVGDDYWNMLRRMAILIIERILNGEGMSIEQVIKECFKLVQEYAASNRLRVEDVLMPFRGLGEVSIEMIPLSIRQWFEAFIPNVGSQECKECGGWRYLI